MSTKGSVTIRLEGIGHVLSDNMLAVPLFQRPYAWDYEQVTQLLNDLDAALRRNGADADYFLGSIVLAYEDRDRAEVVDGQQRLATASILLAAIRDYFRDADDAPTADLIESRYLLARHIRTLDKIPRLRLNERDNDFFVTSILAGERSNTSRPSLESHKRLLRALDVAQAHVERIASKRGVNVREALIDWVTFLDKRVQLIVVEVPDHSDAFTIFETLNDRGAEMDVTDLLKNHLLRLVGRERIIDVDGGWTKVLTALESEGSRATTDFVRHFWSSTHGLTRERQLYSSIRSEISTKRSAIGFVHSLSEAVPYYAAILDPEHTFWDEASPHARHYVGVLNRIGVVAMRPLLLAVMQEFSVPELERALRLFVSWATRLFIVGSLGSGALEERYSDIAVKVRKHAIRSSKDLLSIDMAPTDVEFEHAFAAHLPRKVALAKYYLSVLELAAENHRYSTSGELDTDEPVTIAYIHPFKDEVLGASAVDGENLARLLGNTVLLESSLNTGLAEAGFSAKRRIFSESRFRLTRDVATSRSWSLDAIRRRQQDLASLATRAWTVSTRD